MLKKMMMRLAAEYNVEVFPTVTRTHELRHSIKLPCAIASEVGFDMFGPLTVPNPKFRSVM